VKESTVSYLNFAKKINLERFYDFETLGIRAPDCTCPQETMSRDGKKAVELFESFESLERCLMKNPVQIEIERRRSKRLQRYCLLLTTSRNISSRKEKYAFEDCV
jgi:hypothetical protein